MPPASPGRGGLPDRPVLFFGGKGGVGKTTLAAAWALRLADRGRRTLLVSTDPAHSTADIFGTPLGPEPRPVQPRLWVQEIDPEKEADRYIEDVKRRVAEAAAPHLLEEVERQIDAARVTPGAEEAAVFDRFTRILEGDDAFERVVFDTAPTGQTLRLLSLPELMAAWMAGLISRRRKVTVLGRMWRRVAGAAAAAPDGEAADPVVATLEERRARFERARTVLTDHRRTAFVFVVTPERLPILETEKAVGTLRGHGIPVGGVVVNRVVPEKAEGAFLERRRQRERRYLEWIRAAFADLPLIHVPLWEDDVVGEPALREVGRIVAGGD